MEGTILLNLDSEDEGEIFIGCAGGVDSVAEFHYHKTDVPAGYFCCKVQVKGLKGGHSGGDIHLGLGNANKLLVRFLAGINEGGYVCSRIDSMTAGYLSGGSTTRQVQLTPVWRFVTDTGAYYVNAVTGEFSPLE